MPGAPTSFEARPSSVWDRALAVPLSELDTKHDPRAALGVLRLKCHALAALLFDLIGPARTGLAVAELRRRFGGATFTKEDLQEALASFGADIGDYLDDWLHEAALPGFLVSEVEVHELPADGLGRPQYQTRFHVRNDEPVGGYVRFSYGSSYGSLTATNESDPIYIAGQSSVEVGLVGRMDPDHLLVQPYLALNRGPAYIDLYHGLDRFPRDVKPFYGTRPSAWRPAQLPGVIVDDLDAGFAVLDAADVADANAGSNLLGYRPASPAFDIWRGELPWAWRIVVDSTATFRRLVATDSQRATHWMREELASAWGRYRKTATRAAAGDGDRMAVFSTSLPSAGRWRLAYHLPDLSIPAPAAPRGRGAVVQMTPTGASQGSYDMTLLVGESRIPIAFDATLPGPGWNEVGEFDLPAGPLALAVSNRTSGESVVADAIRWFAKR